MTVGPRRSRVGQTVSDEAVESQGARRGTRRATGAMTT